jgi:hypothetical protein
MSTSESFISLPWIRRHFPGGLTEDQQRTLTDIRDLLTHFESIGTSTRFGTVQRSYAHEYLSLLRWTDLSLEKLIAGLDAGWSGIGKPETMSAEIRPGAKHFFVTDDGVVFHTPETDANANAGALKKKYARRNKSLVKSFLGNARTSSKYFVVFVPSWDIPDQRIGALSEAIRKYNSSNKLLCVLRSTDPTRAGEISVQSPNLIYGYVRERDEDIEDGLAWPDWIKICRQADAIWSGK